MSNEHYPGEWAESTPMKPSEREALLAHIRNFMEKIPTENVFLKREGEKLIDKIQIPEKRST